MAAFFTSKRQEVLFLFAILLAFIAFYIETDIYTPSFPEMVDYFSTDEATIQQLVSMNFFGLCCACLFFGPLSDAFGRKPILSFGLGLFMLGSLFCAYTDSLQWMIFNRFLQGVGCGAIVSAGLTTFFDVYPPAQSARLVAFCNGTIGGMMALAPMIGNWINLHWGWRANFYVIAILAIAAFAAILLCTKETLALDKRVNLDLKKAFINYFRILCNIPFMAHTLIWTLALSIIFVFIANLSLIFIDHLHVSAESFGFYQSAIMTAFFIGSMGGVFLIKQLGMQQTKIAGSLLCLGGFVGLFSLGIMHATSPEAIIFCMALGSFGGALSMTIFFSYSMSYISEELKGAAMSLTQSLRLFLSFALVQTAAWNFDGSIYPLGILTGVYALFLSALYFILYFRREHKALQPN